MAKEVIKETQRESRLAAVAINDGTLTTLITENGRYTLGKNGDLLRSERVDYVHAVKNEFKMMADRIALGQFEGRYSITYAGKLSVPETSR